MVRRALRLLLLAGAGALAGVGSSTGWAQDDEDIAALVAALKDVNYTLQDGLKASEREGKPISAQFQIDDGKLQVSVYTIKGDEFTEVVADPKTGAIVKSEEITDTDDLNDAADQKAAMQKAKLSLIDAADAAIKENAGARAVAIFPDLKDGHAVAEVTLLQGATPKKVTERLD
jgi:hypothetical protein